ncbi:MAG: helix-turn-helix transcriptional regulator [Ruminiclostridium sp.]|nr:helix-turn-helix transcriptional regulator [Ruminiclostridium sp.]
MSVGKTIKRLRQEQNITQEQLAEALGISSRAVSQWECGRTSPDISQLPALAYFFGVTADCLLGVDITRRKDEIGAILEYNRLNFTSAGNDRGAIDYLTGKLRQYPNSPELFDALAASMYSLYFQSGDIDDDVLKREKAKEIIGICERGTECSGKEHTGDNFKQLSVYLYTFLGNREKARETACSLPHIHTTRDMLYPRTLEGREALEAWQELLINLIWTLSFVIGKIKSCVEHTAEEKIKIMRLRERLILLVRDNSTGFFGDLLSDNSLFLSSAYLAANDKDKALEELEKAVGYAYEDPENAAGKDNPLWFSEIDRSKASAVKHTPGTNLETLLDFLERKNYDAAFEGSEAYMKLINKLRAAAGDTANGKTA